MNTDAGLKGKADVTEAIIGAAYQVANVLGAGFLEAQCMNYLRATRMDTGLVINFGRPRIEIQRVIASIP